MVYLETTFVKTFKNSYNDVRVIFIKMQFGAVGCSFTKTTLVYGTLCRTLIAEGLLLEGCFWEVLYSSIVDSGQVNVSWGNINAEH